ncbi:MAG: class I tRNA ligase family protein [Candidatus Paceibacterota bacterium]
MEEKDTKKKSETALREERVLEFWKESKIFSKTLSATKGKKEFIFYEGPPTANGKPGIHHLEARAFKDAIPRYKTMKGFHVRRKGGWDTHGLPVELQVEKKLGLNSKKAIEEYGIAKFNQECKESVWEYLEVWNDFTKRIGYWVDQENPYVTYHNDYIESVWSVIKKINDQNLLYKDYKVVPWCPRCGTALSSHELAQGYEDVKDLSVYVKFKITARVQKNSAALPASGLRHEQNFSAPEQFVLAWTTTPWTLPGNVALAVGENIDYVKIKKPASPAGGENELLILAKYRLAVIDGEYEVLEEFKGKDLIGLEYEPLYPYLENIISESEKPKLEKAYKVYGADFVTTEEGTGVVHTAVMYGQDDFELGTKIGLPKHHLVGLDGKFLPGTGIFEGRFVRDEEVAVDVIKDLAHRGLLLKKEKYEHPYPHCWRCKTALVYYARDSWYIKVSDSKIKEKMVEENKEINWEPAHIRDGRFGQWLEEIKDWAISRERYWGTPLPVWICETCKKIDVVGSIEDIKEKTKKSGNKYFVMRHGESESNTGKIIIRCNPKSKDCLTKKGREQVLNSIEEIKSKNIDVIISSDFIRTKETVEIIKEKINFKGEIVFDERVREFNVGIFDGKTWEEYIAFASHKYNYTFIAEGGESWKQMRERMIDQIYDLEKKYKNKNILIVSHAGPLRALFAGLESNDKQEIEKKLSEKEYVSFKNAEIKELNFVPLPHNENYELDLHRPYIDEVKLVCVHSTSSGSSCGGNLVRTKEVMDVWLDSGCMPFAQDHYPFENRKWVEGVGYPADFISEAIDQTRGWFYTLHAIGVLVGRGKAYKNVICLGHLLDAKGKKMSKSLGNIVDPWEMMDKYGVDTLRLWMYSVNQPGESKNFDEKTVALLHQQVFTLLYNVLVFYELYRDKNLEINSRPNSKNILDQWILARLDELIDESTKKMDDYKLLEPVRGIKDFIGDLSTWYLRRSRERIKEGDREAKATLYFVLKTLTKIMAPFAPFTAEDIWLKLKTDNDKESVHLENWPSKPFKLFSFGKTNIIDEMEMVRKIVTLGLEARQQAGIKVRQPLASLKLKVESKKLSSEYTDLIKDELNVKEIIFNNSITNEVELDINITPALKAEGEYREFMRELQDQRKKLGLNPGDKMPMSIETIYKKYKITPNLQEHMLRTAAVASLICDNFTEPLQKEEIIIACLLHDMGNIAKFDMNVFPESFEPEGVEYWQGVKEEFIKKYGKDQHETTIKIMQELGLPDNLVLLAGRNSFSLICEHRDSSDINMKIVHYADGRVDPCGVVSYDERMDEAKGRYKLKSRVEEEERERLTQCGKDIEKQIFAKCKIKPEDINNKTVAPIILELKNFIIK